MDEVGAPQAMTADPLAHAFAEHRAGRLASARAACDAALAADPANAAAALLRGVLSFQLGDTAGTGRALRAALAADPTRAVALLTLGLHLRGRDGAAAVRAWAWCLRIEPTHGDAGRALAHYHLNAGRLKLALALLRRIVVANPGDAAAWRAMGDVGRSGGASPLAVLARRRAARLDPDDVASVFLLALEHERAGRPAAAGEAFKACVARDPVCVEALFNLANGDALSSDPPRRERGLALYRAAIRLRPDFTPAHVAYATAAHRAHRLAEAGAAARRALACDPANADAWLTLSNVDKGQGRVDRAVADLERVLAIDPARESAFSNLLFTACFKADIDGAALYALHREYDRRYIKPLERFARPLANDPTPGRRLKIGFVSPSFRRHPAGHFLLPFFLHADRDRFELYCYYNDDYRDDVTRRFMSLADHWRFCRDLSDEALAERIRVDRIDILVDGAGHLANARLALFARRPAPIQVSFPVYPATTGLDVMDWRIMDEYFAPPPPEGEAIHSERLARLPDCHVCYEPLNIPVEPAQAPPSTRTGVFTFASFNNFAKIDERTVALWAAILARVPHARLRLKWQGLPDADVRDTLAPFVRHGVDPGRITLETWAPDPYTPYLDVDLCLDPVHANGGTTTCDALWMGVPVATLVGAHPFARVGLCHLSNVGLTELIAYTAEDYVDLAVALAHDPARLAALRRGLRARFQASPLMDAPRYARNLERAFRDMWIDWCAKRPEAYSVGVDRTLRQGYDHHAAGRGAEAAPLYRDVLMRDPTNYDALHLLGVVLRQNGDAGLAARWIARAVRLNPTIAGAWHNLGLAARDAGEIERAVAALEMATVIFPDDAENHVCLGAARQGLLRCDGAERAFRRAVAIDPRHAGGWMNLAWVLLITGRLREGWEAFEWRWARRDFTSPPRNFPQPLWDGGDVAGRTVLLHAEQGFGDTVQMARYIPRVAARGARVLVECPAPLAPLLAPLLAGTPGVDQIVIPPAAPPPFDLHCPMMSLPRALGVESDVGLLGRPGTRPYLTADPARAAQWRARMDAAGDPTALRVGLLWAGNPAFKGDRDRSPRLSPLLPLLSTPGARFFGLQMGDGRRDMEGAPLPDAFVDLGGEIRDFGDSAAIMANLDVMITSCSAPAHLAAALGRPTWIMLPFAPDWRWLLGREDSPWYPSVRLFRQPTRGDWESVVARVDAALRALIAAKRSRAAS